MADSKLTVDVVVFLMDALIQGRISRQEARALVNPWVEGDAERFENEAFGGATIVHGLDLVAGDSPGLVRHADVGETGFLVDQAELVDRCSRWLDEVGRASGR